LRARKEIGHVDADEIRIEPYAIPIQHQRAPGKRCEVLAKRSQRLAQAAPGLFLTAIAPQKSSEPFASYLAARCECENAQERPVFPGRHLHRLAPTGSQAKATEEMQPRGRHHDLPGIPAFFGIFTRFFTGASRARNEGGLQDRTKQHLKEKSKCRFSLQSR
jgi:hypothetical protein